MSQRPSMLISAAALMISSVLMSSCLDDIESTPPCFVDGSEANSNTSEVSVNLCCDPSSDGAAVCREYFSEAGYGAISQLSTCVEPGYCKLCEIGVNCACLGNRDCSSDESCRIVDDQDLCSEQLSTEAGSQRCAICL